MNENDSLRWRVIDTKFRMMDGRWFTKDSSRPHGNGMWKKICY